MVIVVAMVNGCDGRGCSSNDIDVACGNDFELN